MYWGQLKVILITETFVWYVFFSKTDPGYKIKVPMQDTQRLTGIYSDLWYI